MEEFETIFSVKPELKTLEAAFTQAETRYRQIKKQQETILDKLVDEGAATDEGPFLTTRKLGEKAKADFLQTALKFAAYQKEQNSSETSRKDSETLEALTSSMSSMTSAVAKMADTLGSKPNLSGLQRLPVPTWDGGRRSYATWKKKFNHWMTKYGQDKDEQLQRFRNALPKSSWRTDQVKTCKTIDSTWNILDTDFADRRKLMDELLSEINNLKPVRRDSKSFTHFTTTVSCYVNDTEDNGCSVLESSEAPFLMSQLLSKLDPNDNSHFGREMKREGKEETVSNLIVWLHQEASIRSRGERSSVSEERNESRRDKGPKKTENNAANGEETDDEACPLGCKTKNHLAACPTFQLLTVNQRWEIVKQHWQCGKCTCSENVLRESKFVKSLAASITLVDGRIQVRMPWKEAGPPKQSNCDIALKRMFSAEKSFQRKGCFKLVDEEVQKLLDKDFVTKVPPELIDHGKPEWCLPLQAMFTPARTTKVRLVFTSSSQGHDGLSLNDYLKKGPNFINSLFDVLAAWQWNEVAFTGDVRKMFNQILVHPDDQVYHRFLWRSKTSDSPTVHQWLRLNSGDKPAPDIATNAINTLAKLSQAEFPEAAKELQDHVYVMISVGPEQLQQKLSRLSTTLTPSSRKATSRLKLGILTRQNSTNLTVNGQHIYLVYDGINRQTSLPCKERPWPDRCPDKETMLRSCWQIMGTPLVSCYP